MKVGFFPLKPHYMPQMFKFLTLPHSNIIFENLLPPHYPFFFSKRVLIDIFLCRKPVKIGIRYLEDGTKVRVSRGEGASGSIIPRPEILKIRTTPRPTVGIYLKLITFVFFF